LQSGGGFPFERGMVVKTPNEGNKREGFTANPINPIKEESFK
jgi:hypothetical protein